MMRASFIIWNICASPRPGAPTRQPTQSPASPRFSARLGRPRQPILWMRPVTWTSLDTSAPSSCLRVGTANSEMPRVPGGAPSMRASVRCTTFSAKSWSAPLMKSLLPLKA